MDDRIDHAKAFLDQEFARQITLESLAASANLSASRFRHLFKRDTGLAPIKYLSSVRMRRAQALLQTTTATVKSIASAVGYRDQSHFVRDFEKDTGLSPSRFRNRVSDRTARRGQNSKFL